LEQADDPGFPVGEPFQAALLADDQAVCFSAGRQRRGLGGKGRVGVVGPGFGLAA
jgi:hypothetical protein